MRRTALGLTGAAASLVAALLIGGPATPRRAWLAVGDLVSGDVVSGPVVLDGQRPADSAALSGAVVDGGDMLRLVGRAGSSRSFCTRRVPRDWRSFAVARFELRRSETGVCRGSPRRAAPLQLGLRLRGPVGWGSTSWYEQGVLVDGSARRVEVGLQHLSRFIDASDVRQLCISLRSTGSTPPVVWLRRLVLRRRWATASPQVGDEGLRLALLTDSHRVRRYAPLPPAATEGDLTLLAARNEVLGAQILIRRGRRGPSRARIELSSAGPGGAAQLRPALFEQRTMHVREHSTAMFGAGLRGPGHVFDPLVPLPPRSELRLWSGTRAFWLDLVVPEDAAVGRHVVAIEVRAGAELLRRQVTITVLPVSLPHRGRKLVMMHYLPRLVRAQTRARGARWRHLERAYHRLAHAHGAYLVTSPADQRFDHLLPMIDGSLFTDGPGRGEGAPYWPVDLDPALPDKRAFQRAAARAARWFARHAPHTRPFVFLYDEPKTTRDHLLIRRRARWLRRAPAPGNRLPLMVTAAVTPTGRRLPSLVGAVDIWIAPDNFPQPARRRRALGERFFTYNGAEPSAGAAVLDADGVALRSWGWIAWRYRIDLWYYWQAAYYRDIYHGGPPGDPLRVARSYDQRRTGRLTDVGNGDGVLIYPPLGAGGAPLPSVRLKQLRRGVQDRLLLAQVAACGARARAEAIARRLIPRALGEASCAASWPKRAGPWQRARRALLAILQRCRR